MTKTFGTFGFDIHHRYSDRVKEFLDVDGLPEKGCLGYYAAMAHRDQLFFKARRLTTAANSTALLTFYGGNQTFRIASLGFQLDRLSKSFGKSRDEIKFEALNKYRLKHKVSTRVDSRQWHEAGFPDAGAAPVPSVMYITTVFRETGALKEAKDKLEKQVEEDLSLCLQLEKHGRVKCATSSHKPQA